MFRQVLFLQVILALNTFASNTDRSPDLGKQISTLNNEYKYEQSIQILEDIIGKTSSSPEDNYNAYLLKALTYKRLFNYPEVLKNLELAESYISEFEDQHKRAKAEVNILAEKMFVVFDTQKVGEVDNRVDEYIAEIDKRGVELLSPAIIAFYYNVVGVRQMLNKNYSAAEQTFLEGIKAIKDRKQEHLPTVYSKLIVLAEYTKDINSAIDAYNKGMHYAEKYKIDLYKMDLYFSMSRLYATRNEHEKAYYYQLKGSELDFAYNARQYNGRLTILEKEILDKRRQNEIELERKAKIFFIGITIVSILLIIALFLLYRSNKQKAILTQNENNRIRVELQKLINSDKRNQPIKTDELTDRQREIIDLLKQGKTNKEIGNALFISENTVKYHLKIIYNVLGVDNRQLFK